MAILGIGIASIVAAGSRCLGVARQARNYQAAREAMARIEVKEPIQLLDKIEDANDSGTLEAPYSEYSWRREVEPVGKEEDGLYLVVTTVTWSDAGKKSRETITTYIHAPEENLPGTAVK